MESKRDTSAKKQIMTALIATIPTFTYGIQIGWLSPIGPLLRSVDTPASAPLSSSDVTWLAGALPLAAIAGVPVFSYCSDRFGRKVCGIAVSVLSCISWAIKLSYITAPALIVARVVAGLAAGGCFVVVPVYIKEISEDSWRGALGSMNMTLCKLGVIFAYAMGMTPSYLGQQATYLAVSLSHVALFTLMPESPNYLLKIGREKRAIRVLCWLRSVDEDHESVRDEISRLKEEQKRILETPRVTLRSVVNDRATFSALRMVLVLMGIQTLSGCFALMNFAADIFSRAGAVWSPNTLALFVGALQLAGAGFTTVSIEKFGRKIPLACSALIVGICMCALATCFLVGGARWLPVVAACLCILAYGAGLAPVPMVYMAEVFTFQVRAKMAGVSMAFSFFCSSMTVLFYTPVANHFGPYVVFYTFSAVCLLGVVYTVLWVPETKGKSLDEIRKYWKKDEPRFV